MGESGLAALCNRGRQIWRDQEDQKQVAEIETDGYDIAIQLKNKKQVKGNRFGKLEK